MSHNEKKGKKRRRKKKKKKKERRRRKKKERKKRKKKKKKKKEEEEKRKKERKVIKKRSEVIGLHATEVQTNKQKTTTMVWSLQRLGSAVCLRETLLSLGRLIFSFTFTRTYLLSTLFGHLFKSWS